MNLTAEEKKIFQKAGRLGGFTRWNKRTEAERKSELAKVRSHKQPKKDKTHEAIQ